MFAQVGFCQTASRIGDAALMQPKGALEVTARTRLRELRNSLKPAADGIYVGVPRSRSAGSELPVLPPDCFDRKGEIKKKCLDRARALERRAASSPPCHMQRLSAARSACASGATGATSDAPSRSRSRRCGCRWRRARPSAGRGDGGSPTPPAHRGSMPGCGQTSFSSSPERCTTAVPALGLTQIQSMPRRHRQRAVGLDRDLEAGVRAAHRPAPRRPGASARRRSARRSARSAGSTMSCAPDLGHFGDQRRASAKRPPSSPFGADEIGVAEGALGGGAILLAAGPQIAAGKAQEDRASPRLAAPRPAA